uniref:Uncharacterized protein n=1 Tax=Arion vulgaris TaxID=1028688 RepID=A0A0B7ATI2_9EUPU
MNNHGLIELCKIAIKLIIFYQTDKSQPTSTEISDIQTDLNDIMLPGATVFVFMQ